MCHVLGKGKALPYTFLKPSGIQTWSSDGRSSIEIIGKSVPTDIYGAPGRNIHPCNQQTLIEASIMCQVPHDHCGRIKKKGDTDLFSGIYLTRSIAIRRQEVCYQIAEGALCERTQCFGIQRRHAGLGHQGRLPEGVAFKTGFEERLGFDWWKWGVERAFQGEEIVRADADAWTGKVCSVCPAREKHGWDGAQAVYKGAVGVKAWVDQGHTMECWKCSFLILVGCGRVPGPCSEQVCGVV